MTVSILVDIIFFCNFAVVKAEGHFRKPPCEFFIIIKFFRYGSI
jgi:hypothetical protein